MATVEMKPVSFRTAASKLDQIDALAESQHRDRSFVLNEAIDYYLDVQTYHRSIIEQGLRDAKEGRLISLEAAKQSIQKQRKARKAKSSR